MLCGGCPPEYPKKLPPLHARPCLRQVIVSVQVCVSGSRQSSRLTRADVAVGSTPRPRFPPMPAPPSYRHAAAPAYVKVVPIPVVSKCSKTRRLFDHIVGAGEH